ncbi:MAG TPA: cytochrome c oxidase assembly protein [Acidimicrobiales bacterium]|jgi:putative membrane protein|nr:cytochrome c oxidase assembly protein [Acidimicrobiales bacterium]
MNLFPGALEAGGADFWRWQPHPEVWLLVGGVAVLAIYALRVVGPKVVPPGQPVATRSQMAWLVLGVALLWFASDWPMHDVAEEYLFSIHMTQHMLLTFMVPPVLLLATPEWLARLVLGRGRVKRAFFAVARPVPAALAFNALQLLTHWPGMVNASVENALVHYLVHTALVSAAFLLWIPICGPLPELRLSYPAQMLYLFVTSIVPTVPAAWLTFAEGSVYSAYDIPQRLWGISVTTDQQAAGLIMKLVAGGFLWLIITVRFFQWASKFSDTDKAVDQAGPAHDLTWADVEREFEQHPPPPEPQVRS